MKKHFTRIFSILLISALILCLIPAFTKRMEVESKNNNVVVSLYYNDIANRLRAKKLDNAIEKFKNLGVTTMSFSEENINSMVARGDITNIKFNVLKHKFDDESLELVEFIQNNELIKDKIIYDSQLLITKNEETADFLSKTLPNRFTEGVEFDKIEFVYEPSGVPMTVFCIYDGTVPTSDVQLGYNESSIEKYSNMGFDICLIIRMENCNELGYIDTISNLVDKHRVKFISIRSTFFGPEKETMGKKHYTKISELISDKNLSLVITENPSQLSNETPFGYEHIFSNNNSRVLRSYETYDASHDDETHYKFRYNQYLHSTIDRNIRFITVSQIHLSFKTYEECTELTQKAVGEYIKKIKELGYSVNEDVPNLNYDVDLRIPNALSASIMVLMLYFMICIVFNVKNKLLFIGALILAFLGFGVSLFFPKSLVFIFPTAWAVLSPCFALTCVLAFIKNTKDKLKTIQLTVFSALMLVVIMSVFGIVQSSLLSGINYYVNNDIFRGIKLSLFLPLLYALVLFVIMFVKIDYKKLMTKILSSSLGDIKIIWIIAVLIVLSVCYAILKIYITRSGNVNSISLIESTMRNFITDIFSARPRTKEFLVGYPCLTLFIYYIKNTNIKLLQASFFCGAAITAASISNSFCHVFTTVDIIYGRVINGVILGIVVSIAAYIVNLVLVKVIKQLFSKYLLPVITKNGELYSIYKFIIGERN